MFDYMSIHNYKINEVFLDYQIFLKVFDCELKTKVPIKLYPLSHSFGPIIVEYDQKI